MNGGTPDSTEPVISNSQIDFPKILSGVKNYKEIQSTLIRKFTQITQAGINKIGFVSGPIRKEPFSDTDRKKMRETVDNLKEEEGYLVFASTDIFDAVWNDLEETKLSDEERKPKMDELFEGLIRNGITDIYMMPGWEDARGCEAEHKAAIEAGISIHNLI